MISTRTKFLMSAGLTFAIAFGVVVAREPRANAQSCCEHERNHKIRVPGVEVQGPSVTVSTRQSTSCNNCSENGGYTSDTLAVQGQTQYPRSYYYGGGGGGWINDGPVPTVINNLKIDGMQEAKVVEVPMQGQVETMRWVNNLVVVQAVCMDDSETPHPASQVFPDQQVAESYAGEVFRCVAGSWMQVTIGDYANGGWNKSSFTGGQTIVCKKGEALVHEPGGNLHCQAQIPRRNCNERSLLRKYGPGVKVVRWRHQEKYMKTITRMTKKVVKSKTKRTLVLSGGVGGGG